MKKRIYLLSTLLPVLGFLFATPALSAEADLVKAEKVYKRSCATCHGKQGEKPAMGESKIINQLKPEEISTALLERKAGNIPSAGSPAKQRLSEQDIHNLSEYIQTIKYFLIFIETNFKIGTLKEGLVFSS